MNIYIVQETYTLTRVVAILMMKGSLIPEFLKKVVP